MKKETSVAIGIGAFLGLAIAIFLVFNTKNAQFANKKVMNQPADQVSLAPTNVISVPVVLEIQSPDSGTIVSVNTITIKGKATKGNLLVIQSPVKSSTLITTDDTFNVDFPLSKGENVIHISLYTKDSGGIGQEKELRVYNLDEQ